MSQDSKVQPNFGPIKLDTNGYGHIFIDQDTAHDLLGARVILTHEQAAEVSKFISQNSPARHSVPEGETLPTIAWLGRVIETYGVNLGEFEASCNLTTQVQTWKCMGCSGGGISSYPEWKLEFTHKPGCNFKRLQELIALAEAAPSSGGKTDERTL